MTDLSRERLQALRGGEEATMEEWFALLDMAEQLLTLKSALGADAQTTTGFGGALERRPDWTTEFVSEQDIGEEGIKRATARPLTTADEDRIKREAAAMALREVAVCLAALNFRPSMTGAHADELEANNE